MLRLPRIGETIADKYRIVALLGEGGMGAVFRAAHEVMGKQVALKWLQPSLAHDAVSRDRFFREARALARIRHPNVVDIYDVGSHEGALFLVMELLEGESLGEVLRRGELSTERALRLLSESMRGVAAAHRANIIHRDIKPENIFVACSHEQPDGIAKVLDFGVSKLMDDSAARHKITRTGSAMGTPLYMSYEQMSGAPDVDARTDIYSFGVLLYQALTGRLPYQADDFFALVVMQASQQPSSPRQLRPDLPPSLERLVMKALARERSERHATLDELITGLNTLAPTQDFLAQLVPSISSSEDQGVKGSTPPINVPVHDELRPRGWLARRELHFALLLVVGALCIGAALSWKRSSVQTVVLPPRAQGLPVIAEPELLALPEAPNELVPIEPDKSVPADEPRAQTPPPERAPVRGRTPAAAPSAPALSSSRSPPPQTAPPSEAPKSVEPQRSAEGLRSGVLQRDRL
jgi:eukaryotic-like serine/threonine-protein kinase